VIALQTPTTDDERRTELLRLMGVRGHAGVYTLGNFARYVTVYAQQVRALNLVDTLAKSGRLSARGRVAVIGGGISGLTAAAAFVIRGAEKVTVFEREQQTMRVQRSSHTRWLHPRIYDWPVQSAFGPDAGLPIMSWKADYATEVVKTLDKQWTDVSSQAKGRLDPVNVGVTQMKLETGDQKPVITIAGRPATFDIVVLAIGFGLDNREHTFGYWADSPWDNVQFDATRRSFFVSGAGDGALTDLMRLCFLDFKHGDALTAVDATTREKVGEALLAAERAINPEKGADVGEMLSPYYLEAAKSIAERLDAAPELKARRLHQVWLNCPPGSLFGRSSSILNRLVTAYLLHRKRFQLIEGHLDTVTPDKAGQYRVTLKQNVHDPILTDHVIIRHGPDKPLGPDDVPRTWEPFEHIWEDARARRREWSEMRQQADWTRDPLYEHDDFRLPLTHGPRLRIDFGDEVGCVVVTGSRSPPGLSQGQRAGDALRLFKRQLGGGGVSGRPVRTTPEVINAEAAFETSAAYERTIRALCDADIGVFDVSGFESAVMLLLGIRAAVRRGVTITVTQDDPRVEPSPFNLAALNPIWLDNRTDIEGIAKGLAEGFSILEARADYYLDLPVYDAVRRLGKDFRPLEPSEQILILRWFDRQYSSLVGQLIKTPFLDFERTGRAMQIVTTLDSSSPQLVDQRLYAAIRRTIVCVADWTGWRPNVFFEIGVRLAVNEIDPVFIYCTTKPPGWNDETSRWPDEPVGSQRLKEFFDPITFDFSDTTELHEFIARISEARREPGNQGTSVDDRGRDLPRRSDARLSPGRTYKIIVETIDRRNEPGGKSIFDFLLREAEMLGGPAVVEEGGLPVLYGGALAEQVRRLAAEYLITLWYAEYGRYRLTESIGDGSLKSDEEARDRRQRLQRLLQVGAQLRDRLRNVPPSEFRPERDDITSTMRLIEQYLKENHG
jgi:hypothetical protein